MNIEEAQKRIDALALAMLAKGLRQPSARMHISSQQEVAVGGSWKDETRQYGEGYHYVHGATAEDAFAAFEKWLSAQPSSDQRKLNDFLSAVAKAIDLGKETGIEANFLNPLTILMETLSENALIYQEAAE